jgi:hypothetical protein
MNSTAPSHLGFRPIQKIATIHASSGFIRGVPINTTRILFAKIRSQFLEGHLDRIDVDESPLLTYSRSRL